MKTLNTLGTKILPKRDVHTLYWVETFYICRPLKLYYFYIQDKIIKFRKHRLQHIHFQLYENKIK